MIPVVLLPGMMCDARLFGPVMGAFAGHPVLHVPLVAGDDVDALAREVLALAPPRFALAGLSMGGIVAMAVLAAAPERVERLALLDTNPRAELPEVRARRAGQIARARSGDLAGLMREEVMPHYLAPGARRDDILDLCLEMALGLGPEVFARQSAALRDRPDRQEVLAAYDGPALVLTGAHDRLCPMDRHDLMHRLLRNARLAVLDGAGHLPPLEAPEETAAHLRRWLNRSRDGRKGAEG